VQDNDRRLPRATVLPPKPCGCSIGFCRAETMLDALTWLVMAAIPNTPPAQLDALDDAYRAKAAECCGGFRITKD
jgi:hypothetical protein